MSRSYDDLTPDDAPTPDLSVPVSIQGLLSSFPYSSLVPALLVVIRDELTKAYKQGYADGYNEGRFGDET